MTTALIIYIICCLYIGKKRVRRCGECTDCKMADCGMCIYCLDKKKYGGPGRKKKCCEKRQCVAINKSEPTHEPQKEQVIMFRETTTGCK